MAKKKVLKKAKTSKKPVAKKAAKKAVKPMAKKAANARVTKKVAAKRKATRTPKPKRFGLVSVTPGFTVNDAAASIAWYTNVLGFAVKERWEHEGRLLGAEMASGPMSLNLGQDDWKLGKDRVKGQGVRLYFTTGPDIDAFANQVKARGGSLDHDLQDGWGVRAFSITDPDGYKLTFMTPLK